ncbi:MAG: hypothetical protein OJF52_000874 [Nitrospira sp.]|jgi:hypothetical protein|nr:MAG: hypothetical protein OJF52_000874 [Nitrospira sp.]
MFLSARTFRSKNRRAPFHTTPLRLPGQSAAEQLRALQALWYDFLTLPLCLAILTLYEWWRWLFSIPSNPFFLTVIVMVALIRTRQKRRSYKAETARLTLGQEGEGMAGQLIELLREAGHRMVRDIRGRMSPWTLPFIRIQKFSMAALFSRLRLSVPSTDR